MNAWRVGCPVLRFQQLFDEVEQRELAERIGRHQVDVSRIESGRLQSITVETLEKLADVLGMSTDYLLGRDEEPDREPADVAEVGA